MDEMRISLDEMDFRRLVAGQVIEKVVTANPFSIMQSVAEAREFDVKIALQDIGFEAMHDAVPRHDQCGWGIESWGFVFECVYCRKRGPAGYGCDVDNARFKAQQEVFEKGWKIVGSTAMNEHSMICDECIEAGF